MNANSTAADPKVCGMDRAKLERYLKETLGKDVSLAAVTPLAGGAEKEFGYGVPLRVDFVSPGGRAGSAVLHTMSPGQFGHEHWADRARILLWSHEAFNRLPRHVRSFDVGGFREDGSLVSLAGVEEFCLLTEYADGEAYACDLERLRDSGQVGELDLARADALCDYLADIHRVRVENRDLYLRRNRELVGDGECVMGLTDSYPEDALFTPGILEQIEHRSVKWRWRLKGLSHRLRQVHGDFHPWNILFGGCTDFRLLDRSRGEYGDPADDVTCLTANYIFFSLQRSGRLEGIFEILFRRFWNRYQDKTGDREILSVAAPFLAFRALVMASPLWYPHLKGEIRERLRNFIQNVLDAERFDPAAVNAYCEA